MSNLRKLLKNKKDKEDAKENIEKIKSDNNRKPILKRLIVIIAALVLVVIVISLYIRNNSFDEYKVINIVEIENIYNETEYLPFGSYFIRYSNDGVSCIDVDKIIWQQALELKKPLIDICGDYIVIGEQGSNEIYLFDKKGMVNKLTSSYPIIDIQVASQGVIYTFLNDNDVSYLEILDKEGEILVTGKTALDGNEFGYPVDFSVSEDGLKMVVSFLNLNSGIAQTRLVFYNFSEVGKNEENKLVGGFNYDYTLIPEVEFLNNNLVSVFGDNMFSVYSVADKPKLVYETEELFEDIIKSVFYNEKYIGLILQNNETDMPYILHVYGTKGNEILVKEFDFNYTDVKFAKNDILLYNSSSSQIFNLSGVKKFDYKFESGIISMSATRKLNRYIVVSSDKVMEIKLK